MFKRMIFTGLFATMLALPAFSLDLIGQENQGTFVENACNYSVLTTYSGSATFTAKWNPNISGAITLDSKVYASDADETGVLPDAAATPTTVYSKYGYGIYSDSNAETEITHLTSLPSNKGYIFDGFYTSKYNGGVKVINGEGEVLDAASTQVLASGGTATWYAHWVMEPEECGSGTHWSESAGACVPDFVAITCAPGEYLPGNAVECAVCLKDNFCEGGSWSTASSEDRGIVSCATMVSEGFGPRAPVGAQKVEDCGYVLNISDDAELYLHADKTPGNPALAVEIDGKVWYADTTELSGGEQPKTISPNTTKTLHVDMNGTEYTVHSRYLDAGE